MLLTALREDVGAVLVHDFFPYQLCEDAAAWMEDLALERYDDVQYQSEAYRLGPTLNENRSAAGLRADYWEKATATLAVWSRSPKPPPIRQRLLERLSALHELVSPATVNGRELYWGIVREISKGTLAHWDDILREFPDGLLDDPPSHQLALNVFLTVPQQGGETLIWQHRWQERDEQYRVGFGYRDDVVGTEIPLKIVPRTVDLLIFNPRRFHAVRSSSGGRRIAVATFIGLNDRRLMLWS